jgi:hypothetical protein
LGLFKLFNFNDDWNLFYLTTMLFAIFSPALFVVDRTDIFSLVALTYLAVAFVMKPKTKKIDISSTILNLLIWGVGLYILIHFVPTSRTMTGFIFTSKFALVVANIFIFAFPETLIRQGLLEKTQNSIVTNLIMGLAHIGSYTALTGVSSFSGLLPLLLIATISFFIFELVYALTKNTMFEAMFHGISNMRFYI